MRRSLATGLLVLAICLAAAAHASAAMYFGATISGETYGQTGSAPENQAAWSLFERHAGKRVAILNMGQPWVTFDATAMDTTWAHGAIPLVTMGLPESVTLADVASGDQDAAIKAWARAAKAWGHPFLLSPWWEMNGNWYAWGRDPSFISAWRHFHDLVVAEGATNVTWTWTTNSIWSDPESNPGPYYPGDAYVDWVGIDSYNWGRNPVQPDRWISPDQTLTPTLSRVREIAPGKPIAIVEDASSEIGGNKAEWIREMLGTYLPHHPEIKAYLWFDWNFPKNGGRADWPIESSAAAQQAFRQGIQSSTYRSTRPALSPLTKVPSPPPAGVGDAPQPRDLAAGGEAAGGSQVAVGPDGTATVVWSARNGANFVVRERRIAPNGVPAGPVEALSAASQDAFSPQVAVAPDGTATVVWTRSDGSHLQVQARRIAADGGLDASTKDMSFGGQDAAEPEVAVAADGTATVAWKRFDGAHFIVQERRIAADGTREAAPHSLSEAKQDAVEPQVAVAGDGTATVAWSRYDGSSSAIQAIRIAPDGTPQASAVTLSAAGQNAIEPRIGLAPDGTATVAWARSDGSHFVVQARRISPAGTLAPTTANLSAAGGDAAEPELAIGPGGEVTAVWERFDGKGFVIQARRIDSAGNAEATIRNLSATGGDAAEPRVAVAPDGKATVVWTRSDGADFIVQERAMEADGVPAAATGSLSSPGRSAGQPHLALAAGGAVTAVWNRFDGGGDVVQASTLITPPPPTPTQGASTGQASGTHVLGIAAASLRIGRPIFNRRKGLARLPVTVSSPGELRLGGDFATRRVVARAGTFMLLVKARGGQRRKLQRTGSVKLQFSVTFIPALGAPMTQGTSVRLRWTIRRRG